MSTALVESSASLMPAIVTAIQRRDIIKEAMRQRVLVKDKDYGVIPGTLKKKDAKSGVEEERLTLLKPGAEKLCSFFRLHVEKPEVVEKEEDWTGERHSGEPFFYYLICQRLTFNGETVAAQMGSCNSWEKKYRYRRGELTCPQCGKANIRRSKNPPRDNPTAEPGWYCWTNTGGCGANFESGAFSAKDAGQVKNPDAADLVNTILKMAQKRALVAVTLVATNASEFFAQDMEEREVIDADYTAREDRAPETQRKAAEQKPDNGNGHTAQANGVIGAEFKKFLDGKAKQWQQIGLCSEAFFWAKLNEWAVGKGYSKPPQEWPAEWVKAAGDFLRQLNAKLKEPAPAKILETIDKLFAQLNWPMPQQDSWLQTGHGLRQGEVPSEHRAQAIILALQEEVRKKLAAQPQEEMAELPF